MEGKETPHLTFVNGIAHRSLHSLVHHFHYLIQQLPLESPTLHQLTHLLRSAQTLRRSEITRYERYAAFRIYVPRCYCRYLLSVYLLDESGEGLQCGDEDGYGDCAVFHGEEYGEGGMDAGGGDVFGGGESGEGFGVVMCCVRE